MILGLTVSHAQDVKIVKKGKGTTYLLTKPMITYEELSGQIKNKLVLKKRSKTLKRSANTVKYSANVKTKINNEKSEIRFTKLEVIGPAKKGLSRSDYNELKAINFELDLSNNSDQALTNPTGNYLSEEQKNLIGVFKESFYNLIIPYPNEELARGAAWTFERSDQTYHVTLKSIKKTKEKLRFVVQITAEFDVEMDETITKCKYSSSYTYDTEHVYPLKSKGSITSNFTKDTPYGLIKAYIEISSKGKSK